MYGNNPKKLLNKINENKEINIKEFPFLLFGPNNVLNSLCSVVKIKFHIMFIREGKNQKE